MPMPMGFGWAWVRYCSWVGIDGHMSCYGWAWVGTCHAMGGHRLLMMGVVWVWVQI